MTSTTELDWFLKNRKSLEKEYQNKWLAISGNKVVASSVNTKELKTKIAELGIRLPFVTKVGPDSWGAIR